jgi:hypothetical protein
MAGRWLLLLVDAKAFEMRPFATYGCAKLTPTAIWPRLMVALPFRHSEVSCYVVFKSWEQTNSVARLAGLFCSVLQIHTELVPN